VAGHRSQRVAEDIIRELSQIIRELKDPRINSMLSIVKAQVSPDLTFAKVYVSSINGIEDAKNAVKGLESASGFIRHEITHTLKLRRAPELKFIADDSISYSADLTKTLDKIHTDNTKKGE
jgi:ribosome-binding factor A